MAKKEGKTVFVIKPAHEMLERIKGVEGIGIERILEIIIKEKYEKDYLEIGENMIRSRKMDLKE